MGRYTFFTQAAKDGSNRAASAEELVNCYAEIAPGDARTRFTVRAVPGETAFAEISGSVPRAFAQANGLLYAVANGNLFEIRADGSVTDVANVAEGLETSISANGDYVAVAAGGTYYVWTGTALVEPGSGAFTAAGSVAFNDYDTIITELDGIRFEWTETADPTDRNALNFASAEAREGTILRALVDRAQVYLFCTQHVEVWYNTGVAGASRYRRLLPIDDGRGLKGYHFVTQGPFGIFWIGNDGVAYVTRGTGMLPVSTPAVQTDIQDGDIEACGYYEARGHKFCVILFNDRPAWVYDLTTQLWHRRQTGVEEDPWRAKRLAGAFNGWYALDGFCTVRGLTEAKADDGQALKRIMRGKPVDLGGDYVSVSYFRAQCTVGNGATVMLRVSWDGGFTWSEPEECYLGGVGEFDAEVEFYALGAGKVFTPEISVTDDADVVLWSDGWLS